MKTVEQELEAAAKSYGITFTGEQLDKFNIYADYLLEYNKKINLTTITAPPQIAIKHFLDSVMLCKYIDLPEGATLIDVGTGAGFPGIPIKIMRPDINLTLLDSLNKRVIFLIGLSDLLEQKNNIIHGRAEQCAKEENFREKYDFATARAVAALPALCEYCIPFIKIGGAFISLKGADARKELESARQTVKLLGAKTEDVITFLLPDEMKRSIITIKKISQTSLKYPRTSVKIAKTPLI